MRSSVDLPQPEGPSNTRNSPMSRPAGEKASSTSRFTSFRASIFSPLGEKKMRETSLMVILAFLASMAHRLLVQTADRAGAGRIRSGLCCLPPWEENFFQQSEQKTEEKCRNANGDDAGIHQIGPVELISRLHHGSYAFAAIYDFSQDDVGPANVIKNAEGRKNAGHGGTKHQPQHLIALGAKRVSGFKQRGVHAVDLFHHHGQQIKEHAEPQERHLHSFINPKDADKRWKKSGDRHGAHGRGHGIDQVIEPAEACHEQSERDSNDHTPEEGVSDAKPAGVHVTQQASF